MFVSEPVPLTPDNKLNSVQVYVSRKDIMATLRLPFHS